MIMIEQQPRYGSHSKGCFLMYFDHAIPVVQEAPATYGRGHTDHDDLAR